MKKESFWILKVGCVDFPSTDDDLEKAKKDFEKQLEDSNEVLVVPFDTQVIKIDNGVPTFTI